MLHATQAPDFAANGTYQVNVIKGFAYPKEGTATRKPSSRYSPWSGSASRTFSSTSRGTVGSFVPERVAAATAPP